MPAADLRGALLGFQIKINEIRRGHNYDFFSMMERIFKPLTFQFKRDT